MNIQKNLDANTPIDYLTTQYGMPVYLRVGYFYNNRTDLISETYAKNKVVLGDVPEKYTVNYLMSPLTLIAMHLCRCVVHSKGDLFNNINKETLVNIRGYLIEAIDGILSDFNGEFKHWQFSYITIYLDRLLKQYMVLCDHYGLEYKIDRLAEFNILISN